MKIVEEPIVAYNNPVIDVLSATYAGDYCINVNFSDKTSKVIDFKDFLKSSLHPSIRKYLNEEMFKQFKILDGNLNWNDYDMIFPVGDLYDGNI
jgi:hypothetical protein